MDGLVDFYLLLGKDASYNYFNGKGRLPVFLVTGNFAAKLTFLNKSESDMWMHKMSDNEQQKDSVFINKCYYQGLCDKDSIQGRYQQIIEDLALLASDVGVEIKELTEVSTILEENKEKILNRGVMEVKSNGLIEMNIDEWMEEYIPIMNHVIDNADGEEIDYFETYGKELEFVKEQEAQFVWTLIEENDAQWIIPGFQVVNRVVYYITKKPWKNEDIEVRNEFE